MFFKDLLHYLEAFTAEFKILRKIFIHILLPVYETIKKGAIVCDLPPFS